MINLSELKQLVQHQNDTCVSIFMPTHKASGENFQVDQIRLKNLIKEVEQRVIEAAPFTNSAEIEEILQPAFNLLTHNGSFWQNGEQGLAIFLSKAISKIVVLPLPVTESIFVANRFYVVPLLPSLRENGRFYILLLSQNEIHLLDATRYTAREIAQPNVPPSLAAFLQWETPERQLQKHSNSISAPHQGRSAIFHGHGVGTAEAHKERLHRFLQTVAIGVAKQLKHQNLPLLLVGAEYMLAIYRKLNQYPHLVEEEIHGSFKTWNQEDLLQKAWAKVHGAFQVSQKEDVARLQHLINSGRSSNYIRQILVAAKEGRIETLFITVDQQQWGYFDRATNSISLRQTAAPDDEELFNLAAVYTLQNGGTVHVLSTAEMPTKTDIAAIFRY